jgi:murein DD-endopeptidase MepM/ murein hydrolase activator NlpD
VASWKHPFDKKLITAVFGATAGRDTPHRGTDYAPKANALIPAVTKGTVKKIDWSQCLGWYMVQTGWFKNKTYYVQYSHLSCTKHGVDCKGPKVSGCTTPFKKLKVGDNLKLGQSAGRVGNTGDCSRGSHLHLTLSNTVSGGVSGKVYDIEKFIDGIIAEESSPAVKTCPTCKRPL